MMYAVWLIATNADFDVVGKARLIMLVIRSPHGKNNPPSLQRVVISLSHCLGQALDCFQESQAANTDQWPLSYERSFPGLAQVP